MNSVIKNKTGFTLIELLIAISIFAVVAIALYSTFFAGIAVWRRSSEGGNIYQDIRLIFADMTKDLRNIIYMYNEKKEESMYTFSGVSEEVVFVTLEASPFEEDISRKELVKVVYRFDKDVSALIRIRADKSIGFDIEKAEKEVLLKGIEEFKFEYCYDSDDEFDPYLWKEEWEGKEFDFKPPQGIRVTFLVKAERKRKPLKFSKTIFVPIGVFEKEPIGL